MGFFPGVYCVKRACIYNKQYSLYLSAGFAGMLSNVIHDHSELCIPVGSAYHSVTSVCTYLQQDGWLFQ